MHRRGVLPNLSDELHAVIVDLVMHVPFSSRARDIDLLVSLIDNAVYHLHAFRTYDPATALSEAGISRWRKDELQRRNLSNNSLGDYSARIRAVARCNGFAPHLTDRTPSRRRRVTPPEHPGVWARVLECSRLLAKSDRIDLVILANLTFGAGARVQEAARIQGSHIYQLPNGEARVTLINRNGEIREVPVGPAVTQSLVGANREPGDFLIRPKQTRHNVINRLVATARAQAPGAAFNPQAARHRFIVDLMGSPVPFRAIADLADLRPDSHTAQDLSPFANVTDIRRVHELLRGTWS